jgi:hypothetical protein
MKHPAIITAAAFAFAAMLSAAPTQAQNVRSFVSGAGVDTNPCTLIAPCRTLQAAHDATNPGGEVTVLNTAGYGALTITKAISITNPGGVEAGIAVPSGAVGITINANSGDVINLRGLIIEGAGVGGTGIQFNSGGTLTIEKCVVRNLTGRGIFIAPTSGRLDLAVSDTFVANNGGNGIAVFPSNGAFVIAIFNRVEVDYNADNGIYLNDTSGSSNGSEGTVSDSVAFGNRGVGFFASTSNSGTLMMVTRSVTAENGTGIEVNAGFDGNAILTISQTTVFRNTNGWVAASSGIINSFNNNYIFFNGPNTGSLTPLTKQ